MSAPKPEGEGSYPSREELEEMVSKAFREGDPIEDVNPDVYPLTKPSQERLLKLVGEHATALSESDTEGSSRD